ncbi:MAG: Fic family protein [Mycoplasmataceae bacterium]|jgi:fido (protein-threonine AMPylation protein)|nr:Fic family protein [Mycoplasmataceae bacterium]
MEDFKQYKKLKEPNKKKKSENWETAIGLQQVDGLKTSSYLIETAKENIKGKISIHDVIERLNKYYREKSTQGDSTNRTEEADKVSARIAEILGERSFSFSPIELITIHKKLFEDLLDKNNSKTRAGVIRDYNISKKEWVLSSKSVYYASADSIIKTLNYDFEQEKMFNYKRLSKKQIAEHICQFISNIWQIHPFGEGNTRTIAVFTIKYLRTLGLDVNNELFEKHSWYFRNALVRANYNDYKNNVYATLQYLNYFFENLLLNTKHELKNRHLKIRENIKANHNNKNGIRFNLQQ